MKGKNTQQTKQQLKVRNMQIKQKEKQDKITNKGIKQLQYRKEFENGKY